ncbi:class II aldolase/adducin family protein [Escherichia coli]
MEAAALRAGDLYLGNVSAIDRERGLVVIKPSGVAYETMKRPIWWWLQHLSGKVVEGEYRPSSDTATHLDSTVVTRRLAALSIPTPLMPPHGRRRGWRSRR